MRKPVHFLGDAEDVLAALPKAVKLSLGFGLYVAQCGEKAANAKPLKGFGGAGVLEVLEDDRGGTYRAVYTVKFKGVVFVLHVFQKKSKKGIETPQEEMALVKRRLLEAQKIWERDYRHGQA